MDILLIVLAFILIFVGVIGSIVPVIPGPPLSWLGLLIASFAKQINFSIQFLVITLIVTLVITYLDYILPSIAVRKSGGSKYGERGALIGAVFGLIFGIWGVIIGPFIGALIGELIKNRRDINRAFSVAISSFVGFLLSVGIKLVWSLIMLVMLVKGLF